MELKPCPCGEIPTRLEITGQGGKSKWANVSGNCCGEWMIEFRTHYTEPDSDKCAELAREAWNSAKRK